MTQIPDEQQAKSAKRVAAKLQAFSDGLAEDEQQLLDQAIRRYLASEGEADTQGFMKPMYEGDHGYKGRPGTDPSQQPASAGGGDAGLMVLFGAGMLLGTLAGSQSGGEYPQ